MDHQRRRVFARIVVSIILVTVSIDLAGQPLLDRRVSVRYDQIVLEAALDDLSLNENFRVAYSNSLVDVDRTISYSANNERLGSVMRGMVGKEYDVLSRGSYVVIVPVKSKANKADVQLNGQVIDSETGVALNGATVYEVKSLKSVTASDVSGDYRLSVATSDTSVYLAVSKPFYRDTIVEVSTRSNEPLKIELRPDSTLEANYSEVDSIALVKWFRPSESFAFIKNIQLEEIETWQISFVPGLSTNGKLSGEITNNISFNVLAGYTAGTRGFELGGLVNINRFEMSGAQIAGVGNFVGGKVKGAQVSGIVNQTDSVIGAQITGIVNISPDVIGGQVAGVINLTPSVIGVQFSGIANYTQEMTGAQFAGVVNINEKDLKGLQSSGFLNINRGTTYGAQIGVVNNTKTLYGAQFGLINIADSVAGGVPFGLISWVGDGLHRVEGSYNDWGLASVRFVTGVPYLYNIFSGGVTTQLDEPVYAVGYGLGTQFNLEKWLYMNVEVEGQWIPVDGTWDRNINAMGNLSLNIGFRLAEHLHFYFGPSVRVYATDYLDVETGEWGNVPVPDGVLYKYEDDPQYRGWAWLGWQAGVRF